MPNPGLSDADCIAALNAASEHETLADAAQALGLPVSTFHNRIRQAKARDLQSTGGTVSLPEFPDDDISADEIIDSMCSRFTKRWDYRKAVKWFPIKVNENKPVGIAFVGDPHLDDNGTNWPLLKHHADVMAGTEGLYAINIGDTLNNWVGRLARLYADQDTSKSTGRKLTKWFMNESGIRWLVWIFGNHDMWSDDFTAWMRASSTQKVIMQDWQAQFRLLFPNGTDIKVHASHNFPGFSQWNTLHGSQKAARIKSPAHLYASGHTHNWAIHQEESASRDFVYWLIRSRGYKFIDEHATVLGHEPQEYGATVAAIINPLSKTQPGQIQCYADLDEAADYLTWLRSRK